MNKLFVILALILMGAMGGYWWFQVYTPLNDQVASLEAKAKKLDKEIKQNKNIDNELDSLKAEYDQVKRELARYESLISTESKVPEILEKTERVCKESKIEFRDIHISPLVEYEGYSEIPIEVGLEGTYHRIGEFLASMENLRMLNINSGTISITPKGRPIQERGDDGKPVMVQLLNVTLNVRAFILTRGGGLVD